LLYPKVSITAGVITYLSKWDIIIDIHKDYVFLLSGVFMSISSAIQRLLVSIGLRKADPAPPDQADLLQKIAHSLEHTEEVEYSCDDAYQLLDQFAELVNQGQDAASIMPLVQKHLDMCPDCREEFEALLRILESEPV
jgi:primosomal protein N''